MKILIVDDDKDMVSLMRYIFQDEGYEVETANSGEEAIRKLRSGRYPVLILDYDLRDKTGFDIMKYMNDHDLRSKVVMVSGYSRPEVKNQAYEMGISKFVAKPFEIKDLMKDIENLSDTERLRVKVNDVHSNRLSS